MVANPEPRNRSEDKRLLISDLYPLIERDYEVNRKSVVDIKGRWKHLQPVFGNCLASEFDSDRVQRYILDRQKAGAKNGTINRELAALKRMASLALKHHKTDDAKLIGALMRWSKIRIVEENNVRAEFLREQQYHDLARETARIGLWLCTLFELGVTYGIRKGELLALRVRQIDLEKQQINLNPAKETKNSQRRSLPMTSRVLQLISESIREKAQEDYVFTREHDARGHKPRTKQIVDFRKDWKKACVAAGCPGLLFNDLRRTGVRNMIRSGMGETRAIHISGHKTRTVFDRYDITDGADAARINKPRGRPIGQTTKERIALAARLELAGLGPYQMTDQLYPPKPGLSEKEKVATRQARFHTLHSFLRRQRKRIDLEKEASSRVLNP